MKICVLDAWNPEDPALVNSHWVAERTVAALIHADPGAAIEVISAAEVTLARAEMELLRDHDAFAYFGHGRKHLLYRCKDEANEPVPIVGVDQVRGIGARWFHAFACLSGETLCHDAAAAGAAAYLGYSVVVVVEWDVPPLPDELRVLLEDLVTIATLQLAAGQRSRNTIRRQVREASNQILEWLDLNEEEACAEINWPELTGLKMLANLLHQKLVLEGSSVVD